MKALQDLDIFVRTVDSGSLSATARALDLTPAATSAALKRLEAELGVPLFVRSTRSLRLTHHGERFLAKCRPALEALQLAGQQLAAGEQALRGVLKLAAPSDLGRNVLLPWLNDFQDLHPEVDIRLQLSDSLANVYSDPVDAAFRYGKPPDSNLVALPLAAAHRRVLCASPAYLERHGAPTTPHELTGRDCLCFMLNDEVHDRWRFSRDGAPEITVRVRSVNVSNDGDAVRRWALLGAAGQGHCLQVALRCRQRPRVGPPARAVHRLDHRGRAAVPRGARPAPAHAAAARPARLHRRAHRGVGAADRLAHGNSVVLKPADLVPGSAWVLAEIIHRSGIPAGVFNLVMGPGRVIGSALVEHAVLHAISFTGSVGVGHGIAVQCATHHKKIQLEMGGKNPQVVLDDAELAQAVELSVQSAF